MTARLAALGITLHPGPRPGVRLLMAHGEPVALLTASETEAFLDWSEA